MHFQIKKKSQLFNLICFDGWKKEILTILCYLFSKTKKKKKSPDYFILHVFTD